ncbi:MFS transporter [Arthrobacter sp. SAFR-044]|uniref:MFS transporter n=1 Tax=Arthrobacter sp. SAFR-044 TaxID=3387278 RepID=UPI003F7C3A09
MVSDDHLVLEVNEDWNNMSDAKGLNRISTGHYPPVTKWGETKKGFPTLVTAFVGYALSMITLTLNSLGALTPALEAERGFARSEISSLWLFATVAMVVTGPVAGRLIDRFGGRIVAGISIPAFAAMLFLMGQLAPDINGLRLMFFIMGLIGVGAIPVVYTRAISERFNLSRGLAMGIMAAGAGLTTMIIPTVLTLAIQQGGVAQAFTTLAVIALIPLPLVLVFFRPQAADPREAAGKTHTAGAKRDLSALKRPLFWTITMIVPLVCGFTSALLVNYYPLLTDRGMKPLQAAATLGVLGVATLLGRLCSGYLFDRFHAGKVAGIMHLFAAAAILWTWLAPVDFAAIGVFVFGVVIGAEADFAGFIMSRYFGVASFGFNFGIFYVFYALFAGGSQLVIGQLYAIGKSYSLPIWTSFFVVLGGVIFLLLLPRYQKAEEELGEMLEDSSTPAVTEHASKQ